MLVVMSPHEIALTKAAQKRIWDSFMSGGSNHSSAASTLPYIIRRCERERQGYTLRALPGMGYYVEPANA